MALRLVVYLFWQVKQLEELERLHPASDEVRSSSFEQATHVLDSGRTLDGADRDVSSIGCSKKSFTFPTFMRHFNLQRSRSNRLESVGGRSQGNVWNTKMVTAISRYRTSGYFFEGNCRYCRVHQYNVINERLMHRKLNWAIWWQTPRQRRLCT